MELMPLLSCDRAPEARGLVGRSPQLDSVRRLIETAARNRALPALLLGQTGTGKEVVARAIHQANPRGQFVPIDCGSLVGTLMESELFGHVKGSFSGAAENKKGLVELADGGTAFFDEIGDLPLEMQVKLLRLLQEREFRAVGSLQWRRVDLRIIAATHRDLKVEVASGRFRQDLFYRLNVFPIRLPALCERRPDIPLLIEHFLRGDDGEPRFQLPRHILDLLVSHDWTGNVRELQHCILRMTALRSEGALDAALPSALRDRLAPPELFRLSQSVASANLPAATLAPISPVISLPQSEKHAILAALESTGGNRSRAARVLEIGRTTLFRKMKQYGIE